MPDPSPPAAAILVTPKDWWRSRLIRLGAGVSLYGVASVVANLVPNLLLYFPGLKGSLWGGTLHAALGLAILYLRTRTSRPIAGTEKAKSEG